MNIGIVDDVADIGEMLQIALELAGHHVSFYCTSTTFLAAAIPEQAPKTPAPFDLLLIDLILPEVHSGTQVVQKVKRVYPDVPIIIITAATLDTIEAALQDMPGTRVLRKPFKLSDLFTVIQETKFP